jgi:microcystin-dependent protein
MSTQFLSEIRIMSFNFAPRGWALCNGQILPINQNQALFSLLGTTYGGNGQTNFALPNLQGRVPTHMGNGLTLGQRAGEEAHTVVASEMPVHNHPLVGTSAASTATKPTANVFATTPSPIYVNSSNVVPIGSATIAGTGGSQPHENRQPYLALNFCIALVGIFPPRD